MPVFQKEGFVNSKLKGLHYCLLYMVLLENRVSPSSPKLERVSYTILV